ncbi:MAG TPA: N-acetylmuramic acid 6-phosphate etherase [Actinoplanes sp.]|nr:N-acetylmuramic acid 6-phosphate etherase [Actinoplanes sp.]
MNRTGVRVSSPTELVNPRTADIDVVPTVELVQLLHEQDALVPAAVAQVLPVLARLVDDAAARVQAGGRVHYFGAGTSGRLGVLDAAELLPTFGIDDDVVVAHQAGGAIAFLRAVEDAEDGGADAESLAAGDVVIGLAASGRTPYVGAALAAGRAVGAVTALVTANPKAPLADLADHLLVAPTGPEALAGSTRLKAGTAQKMILNMFSSALMIRLGHTYRNLLVDMRATNAKLRGRSIELLIQATGRDENECARALDECGELKTALVHLLTGRSPSACRAAIEATGGVRKALEA